MKKADHEEVNLTNKQCDSQESIQDGVENLVNKTNGNRLMGDAGTPDADSTTVELPATECQSFKKLAPDEENESDIAILKGKKLDMSKIRTKDENSPSEHRRRSSTRLQGKRPKLTEIITTDEEENLGSDDDFHVEDAKSTSVRKRGPSSKEGHSYSPSKSNGKSGKKHAKASSKGKTSKKISVSSSKLSKEFTSGAFVVLKTDFHSSITPPIWRIDGKALLQKYTHFDLEGETLYKNTSTYSGWIANNKDQYYPLTVEFKSQSRKETVVKVLKDATISGGSG